MDVQSYIIGLIVLIIYGIILSLLPSYIALPIVVVTAVSGPIFELWKYEKLKKKPNKED